MPASIARLPRTPLQIMAFNPMHPRPVSFNPKAVPAMTAPPPPPLRAQANPKLHRSVPSIQIKLPEPERSGAPTPASGSK